jgi:hypothetical protein
MFIIGLEYLKIYGGKLYKRVRVNNSMFEDPESERRVRLAYYRRTDDGWVT